MEKIALITGGTSGIGLECAKKFLVNKINVILVGRNKDKYIEAKKYYNELQKIDKPASEKYNQFFN
jgi:short-subunit dehydrogenase